MTSEEQRMDFDRVLNEPRPGRAVSTQHTERLRESEMASFDRLLGQMK